MVPTLTENELHLERISPNYIYLSNLPQSYMTVLSVRVDSHTRFTVKLDGGCVKCFALSLADAFALIINSQSNFFPLDTQESHVFVRFETL